jgi:hypothetical protein
MHPIHIEEIAPIKMLVVYDEQGDILSVDLPSDTKSESIMLRLGKRLFVAEVDISQAIYAAQIETCQSDISKLVENIANDFRIQQGKLVPRDG